MVSDYMAETPAEAGLPGMSDAFDAFKMVFIHSCCRKVLSVS